MTERLCVAVIHHSASARTALGTAPHRYRPNLYTPAMMGATEDAGGPPAAVEELPPPAQSQFSISSPDEVVIPPTTPDDTTVPSVTGEGTMSDGKGNLKKVLFLSGGDANQPPKENASKGWSFSDVSRRASARAGVLATADEEARAEGGRARSERAQEHE